MKIAVNTRFLLGSHLEGYGYYLQENFSRIVRAHPEHEFLFIFDRPYEQRFIYGPNVTPVVAGPTARHPVLWKLWYDIKVPAILRKYKADVFVSCDGFCSLSTRIPQCLVVHDLSYLHFPGSVKKSHLLFYRRYTPKFLARARSVVTVSAFSKKDILAHFPGLEEKISVVPNAARSIFHPIGDAEKNAIRNQFTGGRDFFLCVGSIHPRKNLMNLLKAFSVFKKKQKSNWKLVLAGRLAWKYRDFVKSLETYKYRDDIVLTGYLAEKDLAGLVAAAYCLVYPSLWEGFGMPVLEALQSETAVITSAQSAMQEVAGDAALYADPLNFEDIASQMMRVYKDEQWRSELIKKGKTIASRFNWDQSASLLWQCIARSVG